MDPAGRHIVITGAASGIGRACAARFAEAGARVVIADLDGDAAQAAAAEIEGALAVRADVGREREVASLIETARAHNGPIDLFFSNAGIGGPPGLPDGRDGDAAMQLTWDVNVMAHVRASRELLPDWLERGRGCFVVTASAAGLLTMLGSATYSATKHAAEAYAEWLAATYAHRGLTVHCICPQGVKTSMLAASGQAGQVVLKDAAIEPEQVAEALLAGMAAGQFLILPHPEVRGYYELRASDTDKWLRGMSRMQQRIEEVERGLQ